MEKKEKGRIGLEEARQRLGLKEGDKVEREVEMPFFSAFRV